VYQGSGRLYSPGMRRQLLLAAVCLGLLGSGAAFLRETGRALTAYDGRRDLALGVIAWRFGLPQVDRLDAFLRAARPLLPPGEPAVFGSPDDAPGQRFFRYRWAAFLLPEVPLLPLDDPAAGRARLLLNYGPRFEHPRLRFVRRLPGGQLYRVLPP